MEVFYHMIDNINEDQVEQQEIFEPGNAVWPFNVTRLFYKKSEYTKAKTDTNYNINAVFSQDHTCGWAYDLIAEIEKNEELKLSLAVTIVQCSENYEEKDMTKYEDINLEDFDRIDVDTVNAYIKNESNQRPCGNIRTNSEFFNFCLKADAFAMLKYSKMKHGNIKNGIEYFEYYCERTKMTELLFPIYIYDKIVAVLITGQIVENEAQKKIALEEIKKLESEYDVPSYESEKLSFEILKSEKKHKLIEYICNEIKQFEDHLMNRLSRNERSFFFTLFSEFRKQCVLDEGVENITVIRDRALQYLKEKMSLDEIYYFALNNKTYMKDKRLVGKIKNQDIYLQIIDKNVAMNGNNAVVAKNKKSVLLSNDSCIHKDLRIKHQFTEYEIIYNYISLSPKIKKQIKDNLLLQGAFIYKSKIKWTKKQQYSFVNFMESIHDEIYRILSHDALYEERNIYSMTLSFIAHEMGQQIIAAEACMVIIDKFCAMVNDNLLLGLRIDKDTPQFEIINNIKKYYDKYVLTYHDLLSIHARIRAQSDTARAHSYSMDIVKEKIEIYKDILNSLTANYRIILRTRNMRILKNESRKDEKISELFGDKYYISLAVLNLVSNATKYGYMGTKIYYSCYKINHNGKLCAAIEIINYGAHIPESEREKIFEFGVQIENNKVNTTRGMGYGLYFVKQIVDEHNGDVEVKSDIVCKYSVSYLQEMIDVYDKTPEEFRGKTDKKDFENEKSEKSKILEDAVHINIQLSDELSPISLYEFGHAPTAMTSFIIYLPLE